jgi:tRNA-dihydrouridine synthase B
MLKAIQLGTHRIENPLMLAPMAGITDLPFRQICRQFGAGYTVSEMLASKPDLENTAKSSFRRILDNQAAVNTVQIVGYDPEMLANAAQKNVENGADVIDINMGCPAKKVCNVASGSALMQNEPLVSKILNQVVAAVTVPVTLKMRTGWDTENRNAASIASIAEDAGIQMIAIHGRTRACLYNGEAEFETIRAVKAKSSLPIVANGDICTAGKAKAVLEMTGVDGLMIGRGAHGQPWIFAQISAEMQGIEYAAPNVAELEEIIIAHLSKIHGFYGEPLGVRMARKHLRWYLEKNSKRLKIDEFSKNFWHTVCRQESSQQQLTEIRAFFNQIKELV